MAMTPAQQRRLAFNALRAKRAAAEEAMAKEGEEAMAKEGEAAMEVAMEKEARHTRLVAAVEEWKHQIGRASCRERV